MKSDFSLSTSPVCMHASFLPSVLHLLRAYITGLGGVGLATPSSKADGFQLESFLRQGESGLLQLIITVSDHGWSA